MIRVHTFTPTDYFGSNCFLIESNGEYAVVDPSVKFSEVEKKIPELSQNLRYILLTHCHFDHIYAIDSWKQACHHVPVIIGREDGPGLSDPRVNCYLGFLGICEGYNGKFIPVNEGSRLKFADTAIHVIATPGHTAGGVSYRINDHLFVGDTLFEGGGYGRTDLPGGDFSVLEKSIIKIFTHEADGHVYCGHGLNTTLHDIINKFM